MGVDVQDKDPYGLNAVIKDVSSRLSRRLHETPKKDVIPQKSEPSPEQLLAAVLLRNETAEHRKMTAAEQRLTFPVHVTPDGAITLQGATSPLTLSGLVGFAGQSVQLK